MNDNPLRERDEEYRTRVATEETEPGPPPSASAPPWIAVGLVLLVIFLGLLVYAVVLPLLA